MWAYYFYVPVTYCWIILIVLAVRLIAVPQFAHRPINNLLILFFFLMVGGLHATMELSPPDDPRHIKNQITQRLEVALIGTLEQSPEVSDTKTKLLVSAEQIIWEGHTELSSGLVSIAMPDRPPADLQPGDKLIARVRLSPAKSYGVKGAYDYKSYLALQSIWTTGWISSPLLIKKINHIESSPLKHRLKYLPEIIRYKISKKLSRLPSPESGIYKAILIGDRSGISVETAENFKAIGAIHLLAISGMHMGILALCSGFIILFFFKRSERLLLNLNTKKIAAFLTIIPLFCYALIAGFQTPVVRALIMVTVFIAALIFDRQWSITNNVAIAAMIILAVKPALLFTVSFQLSFAAVSAISLFSPQLHNLYSQIIVENSRLVDTRRKLLQWCFMSIAISIIAILGTAPILAWHFNRVSIISPISTILIEPFLCLWSLILGLTACLFMPLPYLPDILLHIGTYGIKISIFISSALAALPHSSIWLPDPDILNIFAWYFVLIIVSRWQKINKKMLIWALPLCLTPLLLGFLLKNKPKNQSEITVLDVGQGNAIIIELPDKKTILIDGGQRQAGSASNFNPGKDLIAPFLWHKKISKIDAVILSHPDADHYNGLPFILERFRPDTLWINNLKIANEEKTYRDLIQLAENLNISIKVPQNGEKILKGHDFSITSMGNPLSAPKNEKTLDNQDDSQKKSVESRKNYHSLVLRLEHGNKSFLFPGDIEQDAENTLLTKIQKSTVLVAPHHGSITSSSEKFIKAVSPSFIAVSAGRFKPDKFPDPSIMEFYKKMGSKIHLTAQDGSITFKTDGQELEVSTFY